MKNYQAWINGMIKSGIQTERGQGPPSQPERLLMLSDSVAGEWLSTSLFAIETVEAHAGGGEPQGYASGRTISLLGYN